MCCLCEVNETHLEFDFCIFFQRNHPFFSWLVWRHWRQHCFIYGLGLMSRLSASFKYVENISYQKFLVLCHRRNLIFLVFPFLALSSSFFFSLIIHLFTQNTRLVSKVSSPAWPLLSLSTAVLTPSRVGSPILSEGTLKRKKDLSSFPSVPSIKVQVCICRVFDCGGLWFAFNLFSLFFFLLSSSSSFLS